MITSIILPKTVCKQTNKQNKTRHFLFKRGCFFQADYYYPAKLNSIKIKMKLRCSWYWSNKCCNWRIIDEDIHRMSRQQRQSKDSLLQQHKLLFCWWKSCASCKKCRYTCCHRKQPYYFKHWINTKWHTIKESSENSQHQGFKN